MSSFKQQQQQKQLDVDDDDLDEDIIELNTNTNNRFNKINDEIVNKFITVVPIDKEAPCSNCWYHGRLDRLESEDRLRKSNKTRCFLVRESTNRPGSYVLSYLALDGSFNHYKITAVFGDYYIGGRQFDRLETLVSYYMYYSELKKGETLLNPVAPSQICRIERNCVSIKSHDKIRNSDELSFLKGDYIKVYHPIGDGEWFWAQLVRTNEYGLVNIDSIRDVELDKLHELEPWYFQSITKDDTANILTNAGQFSFLVRPSDTLPGSFTLYFYVDNTIHRYRIIQNDKSFQIGGRTFDSISSIIERYKYEDLIEGGRRLVEWNYSKYRNNGLKHQLSHNTNSTSNSNEDDDEDNEDDIDDGGVDIDDVEEEEEEEEEDVDVVDEDDDDINRSLNDEIDVLATSATSLPSTSKTANNNHNHNGLDFHEDVVDTEASNHKETINNQSPPPPIVVLPTTPQLQPQSSIETPKIEEKLIKVDVKSSIIATDFITNHSPSSSPASHLHLQQPQQQNEVQLINNEIELNDLNLNKKRNSIGPDIFTRKSDQVIKKGFLNKYNAKTKKWKPYWFVLNSTERQLFYFANEKRIKEKGLIDLCYGLYYPVHYSLFNKPFCFQIIIRTLGNSNCVMTYYLQADNGGLFEEWTQKIRSLCDTAQLYHKIEVKQPVSLTKSTISIENLTPQQQTRSSTTMHYSLFRKQQQPQYQTNFFIERSLHIEIKEGRNLTNLISTMLNSQSHKSSTQIDNDNHSSLVNNTNHHHHPTLSKQISAPTPSLIENGQHSFEPQQSHQQPQHHQNEQSFKNYYFYCLILFNNDIIIAKTKQLQNVLVKNLHQTNNDLIWNETFKYENIPLDIKTVKILIFATKNINLSIDTILNNFNNSTNSNHGISTSTTLTTTTSLFNLLKFRNSNNILIGELNLKLNDLLNNGLDEKWYKIDYVSKQNQVTTTNAQIRLKIRFNEEKILFNLHDYSKLQNYLTTSIADLSIIYDCICPTSERTQFVSNLIDFYFYQSNYLPTKLRASQLPQFQLISDSELRLLEILKLFLNYEIARCVDLNTLFRSTTLTTSLMDCYMRSKTELYLRKALYEPLFKIFNKTKNKSFELDPAKLQQYTQQTSIQTQLNTNLQHFKQSLTTLLDSICKLALQYFPPELIYLFQHIRTQVNLKWSQENKIKNARVYCISSFIFLRLICPSLLNLTVNNSILIDTHSDIISSQTSTQSIQQQQQQQQNGHQNHQQSQTQSQQLQNQNNHFNERYIKLLTKALQTLANLTECKEPFMQPLSDYLNENKTVIIKFIDHISNYDDLAASKSTLIKPSMLTSESTSSLVSTTSTLPIYNDKDRFYLCKNLACLHRLFQSFIKEILKYVENNQLKDSNNNNNDNLLKLIGILEEINSKINTSCYISY